MHNVQDYGADPTYGLDSTAAFNNAINAARIDRRPVRVPAGKYKVSTIDASQFRDFPGGLSLLGDGAGSTLIYGVEQTTPQPVIDCVGSSELRIEHLSVMGMTEGGEKPNVIPSCGVLTAESVVRPDCNRNRYLSVSCLGFFSISAFVSIGQTNSVYEFCTTQQWLSTGRSLYISGYNPDQLSGTTVGINSTPMANNELSFLDCEFHSWNNETGVPSPATVPTLWFEGHNTTINNLRFTRCLIDSSYQYAVFFNGVSNRVSFRDSKVYSEIGYPAPNSFMLADGGWVSNCLMDNVDLTSVGNVIAYGPNGGNIQLRHV